MTATSVYCSKCNEIFETSFSLQKTPQDFFIKKECKNGHIVIINLTDPLYSILFDNCIIAYFEQKYRSCVFEAASALERFYEHAIRVMIIPQTEIDSQEIIESFNKTWKIIKNMTERQIGAFTMLFHKTTGRAPILLNEKSISLRNNIIHKGYIPSKEEAYEFLSSVSDLIQKNRNLIRPHDEQAFWLLDQRVDYENLNNPPNVEVNKSTLCAYSKAHFFNSTFGSTFKESLETYYSKHLKNQ